MNASQSTIVQANKPPSSDESKPGFRSKTIATRLTPDELAEVESATEQAGKPLAEWLRETALTASRQRPADPVELLLAEIWAVRYALLSLFHAGAEATAEGKPLLPESVLKIRDRTDARKLEQGHKMLAEFLAQLAGGGNKERSIGGRSLSFSPGSPRLQWLSKSEQSGFLRAGSGRRFNVITCLRTSGVRCG